MRDIYETFDFVAANGVPFRAVVSYNDRIIMKNHTPQLSVAFYDQRHDFSYDGQFTGASYYVSNLLGSSYERLCQSGLDLYGPEPSWKIDARSFRTLTNWLMEICA